MRTDSAKGELTFEFIHDQISVGNRPRINWLDIVMMIRWAKNSCANTIQRNHYEPWSEDRFQRRNNKIKMEKEKKATAYALLSIELNLMDYCFATLKLFISQCNSFSNKIKHTTTRQREQKNRKKWSTKKNRVQFFIGAIACAQFIVCCCGCRLFFSYCCFNRTILLIK